jgi:transcriptional regulator with XRE-family HTH domain
VQDVEAGNKLPSILTLVKLCDALNITPDKLLLPVLNHYKKLKKTRK